MITNINFNRSYISFENSVVETVYFHVPQFYKEIFCFLQVNDGIICVLATQDETPDEKKRRNVVKIDEHGEIIWVVMDPLDDYRKRFSGYDPVFERERRAGFNNIYMRQNKIVLSTAGLEFFLDPKTGVIELME